MFAPCLLPALLLLAIAAVSSNPLPPYHVTALKGDDEVVLSHKKNFYIPDGQCYGIFDVKKQEEFKCHKHKIPVALRVDVWDYKRKVKIEITDALDNVSISRTGNCKGNAYVKFALGCDFPESDEYR